jgi:hypothetical protein
MIGIFALNLTIAASKARRRSALEALVPGDQPLDDVERGPGIHRPLQQGARRQWSMGRHRHAVDDLSGLRQIAASLRRATHECHQASEMPSLWA